MDGNPLFRRAFTNFLISILCCISIGSIAQTKEIEQLSLAIQKSTDDKEKSDLISQLADKLFAHDFVKSLPQSEEALRLAVKSNYKRGQAQALTTIGTYHYYNGDYVQSAKFYHDALHVIKGEESEDFPAKTLFRLGILYRQQAYFDSATYYFDKSEDLIKNQEVGLLHASLYASQGILADLRSRSKTALRLLNKSLAIRLKFGDSVRIADTWCNMGVAYSHISNYDSAEYCYAKAEDFLMRINDPETYMHISLSRGETSFSKGDFNSAIENYTIALNALKNNTYKRYYATLLFKIGELYENQGAYNTAYEYIFSALKEFEKTNSRQDLARAYSQIGWCYNYLENYSLALENANHSLQIAELINDSSSIAQNQNLIGFTYFKTKKYSEALGAFEQALIIRRKIGHWWGVSFTLYNKGLTYLTLGQNERAYALFMESLAIDERIGKKVGIIFTSNELGYQFAKQRNFTKAFYYLAKANKLASSIPVQQQLLANYKNYIFLYEQQRDNTNTIKYFKLYTTLKDSLSNELNSSRISKADAVFQLQKKAAEVELANKENELHQEKIKTQESEITFQQRVIIIVSVCLIILIVLSVVIYKLFKSNKNAKEILGNQNKEITEQREELQVQSEELTESNERLYLLNGELNEKNEEIEAQGERIKEANKKLEVINNELEIRVEERTSQLNKAYSELETFFYRTSHDFRRPLTTYLGLAEMANATIKDKQALDLFEKVRETTLGLDNMLTKLQSISNVDFEKQFQEFSFSALLTTCLDKHKLKIESKGIKVITNSEINLIKVNEHLLKIVLENLIENSVHFSSPINPYLRISVVQPNSNLNIIVEDNGQGISATIQHKIFEMYFRGSDNSKGNGLGLYIAKRAVDKLGGKISFISRLNEGTSFNITIPTHHN